jgi:hypothetical protein
MTKNKDESKEGLYDVYYQENGKKIIVLEGLNAEDVYEVPVLQKMIHDNYGVLEIFYWILFLCTAIYLIGLHLVLPILRKFNLY